MVDDPSCWREKMEKESSLRMWKKRLGFGEMIVSLGVDEAPGTNVECIVVLVVLGRNRLDEGTEHADSLPSVYWVLCATLGCIGISELQCWSVLCPKGCFVLYPYKSVR
jgi:hypothetical protein